MCKYCTCNVMYICAGSLSMWLTLCVSNVIYSSLTFQHSVAFSETWTCCLYLSSPLVRKNESFWRVSIENKKFTIDLDQNHIFSTFIESLWNWYVTITYSGSYSPGGEKFWWERTHSQHFPAVIWPVQSSSLGIFPYLVHTGQNQILYSHWFCCLKWPVLMMSVLTRSRTPSLFIIWLPSFVPNKLYGSIKLHMFYKNQIMFVCTLYHLAHGHGYWR